MNSKSQLVISIENIHWISPLKTSVGNIHWKSSLNIFIEHLIWDIKDYSGEEIDAVDDELLSIKLKDDLLYFNIDAAKSITDSYVFYEVYGNELITAYQEKLMVPSDLPKDIAVKLIPSSTIKNMKPIEYAFDIEPIKQFLEEKSW